MNAPLPPAARFEPQDGEMHVRLEGQWSGNAKRPALPDFDERMWTGISLVRLDSSALCGHDSALLAWLLRLAQSCDARKLPFNAEALPEGLQKLLVLARTVPAQPRREEAQRSGLVASVGESALRLWSDLLKAATFTGEITLSLLRLLRGRARFRLGELLWQIEACGVRALPIVSLISFLIGTVLAYMGAVQLGRFGAQIYIADLVAIGMVREIGALMTGIILAGRTGAAYAAQLGTMEVNEEIDAFRTLGISPIDYLVLPRLLALVLMVPLLTMYSDIVGIIAGMFIAGAVFDVGVTEYVNETVRALSFTHIVIGIVKGTIYGALVAFSGCLRGIQCGRNAQAVGEAATSAVVTAILLITVFGSLLTVMFQKLGL